MSESTMEKSPYAGKAVRLADQMNAIQLNGKTMQVEDWWVNVSGKTHIESAALHNPAAMGYEVRVKGKNMMVPMDDKVKLDDVRVLYGKVGSFGFLVHVSEIRGEVDSEGEKTR